jgi:hypothetical protein
MEQKHQEELDVKAVIDAVKVSGSAFLKEAFEQCSQFHREYNYRLTGAAEEKLYDRVCGYITPTGLKIGVAYQPAHGYMPACIFTVTPPDTGLERRELDDIIALVPEYRFTKIECAFVFRPDSVVNLAFARRQLVVGKSKRSDDPRFPDTLYFGSRNSPVFARCYTNPTTNSFKVEPEFHRQWLDKHHIYTTADFTKLALLARRHVAFYKLDPLKASAAFARMGVPVASTLRKVIARQDDIYQVLDFLRHDLEMANALRVFTPLSTNTRVARALELWAERWADSASGDDAAFEIERAPLNALSSGGK